MPRYRQLVETVFERLGHSATDFAGYRLRMRFPPIPTLAVFRLARCRNGRDSDSLLAKWRDSLHFPMLLCTQPIRFLNPHDELIF